MSRNNAPVFRKAVNGYNKKDVNNYIVSLSKMFSEAENGYKATIDRANADISEKAAIITGLQTTVSTMLSEASEQKETIARLQAEIFSLTEKCNKLEAENEQLNRAEACPEPDSSDFGGLSTDAEKALMFDCISAKTGEIMLIACKTADEIVSRANEKAAGIIGDAQSKKENVLKDVSTSADSVASDISAYIKTAVNDCLERIYSSIKNVEPENSGAEK